MGTDDREPMIAQLLRAAGFGPNQEHSVRELGRRTGLSSETARRLFRPISPGERRVFYSDTAEKLAGGTPLRLETVQQALDADMRIGHGHADEADSDDLEAIRFRLDGLDERDLLEVLREVTRRITGT